MLFVVCCDVCIVAFVSFFFFRERCFVYVGMCYLIVVRGALFLCGCLFVRDAWIVVHVFESFVVVVCCVCCGLLVAMYCSLCFACCVFLDVVM